MDRSSSLLCCLTHLEAITKKLTKHSVNNCLSMHCGLRQQAEPTNPPCPACCRYRVRLLYYCIRCNFQVLALHVFSSLGRAFYPQFLRMLVQTAHEDISSNLRNLRTGSFAPQCRMVLCRTNCQPYHTKEYKAEGVQQMSITEQGSLSCNFWGFIDSKQGSKQHVLIVVTNVKTIIHTSTTHRGTQHLHRLMQAASEMLHMCWMCLPIFS